MAAIRLGNLHIYTTVQGHGSLLLPLLAHILNCYQRNSDVIIWRIEDLFYDKIGYIF